MSSKRSSPNGKQRLLSFLRDLLNDVNHSDVIMWTNETEQEFVLVKPHRVAELWGAATGNPNMNYDKMSRGLRYFYGNNTLGKMPGKNSGYKFLDNSNHSSPNSSLVDHTQNRPDPQATMGLQAFNANNVMTWLQHDGQNRGAVNSVPQANMVFNGNNVMNWMKQDGQNKSLPSSPNSDGSSVGSTSPIAAAAAPLGAPLLHALMPTTLAQMAQLTQNLTQFNMFKVQFPMVQALPLPGQLQLFFNFKNAFPAVYPPAVIPGPIAPAAPIV